MLQGFAFAYVVMHCNKTFLSSPVWRMLGSRRCLGEAADSTRTIYSYTVKKKGPNLGTRLMIKATGGTWLFSKSCVHSWKNQKNVFGKRFRQYLNKPCVPVVTPGELAEGVEGSSPVFEVPRGLPRTPLRSSSAEFVCWSCYCVSLHLDLPSHSLEILLILVLNVRWGLPALWRLLL